MNEHVFDLSGEKNTLVVAKAGRIASVTGTVLIQNDKGETIALHAGQSLNPGDHILLVSGTFTITLDSGEQLVVGKQAVFGDHTDDDIVQPGSSHEQPGMQKAAGKQQLKDKYTDNSDTDDQEQQPLHSNSMTSPFFIEVDRQEVTPDSGIKDFSQQIGSYGVLTETSSGVWAYQVDTEKFDTDLSDSLQSTDIIDNFLLAGSGGNINIALQPGISAPPVFLASPRDTHIDKPTADIIATSDSGKSHTDNITNDKTPTIQGKAEAGSTVIITDTHGHEIGRGLTNSAGHYTITTSSLVDGHQNLIITATDKSGNSAHTIQPITVDTTISAAPDSTTAFEGQSTNTSGNVLGNDEKGATVTTTDIVGKYGTYHFQANGSFVYVLDNQNVSVNTLPQNAHLLDPVQYAVIDAAGNTTTATLTTDITGINNIPVITAITSGTLHEGDPTIGGQINATDSDSGDTFAFSTPLAPALASKGFVLKADGSYSFDPANKAFDHLAVGEHETLTIPIIATDNHGGASLPQNLIITVEGTNDKPVISAIAAQAVDEGAPAVVHGQITATDIDHGDILTYSTSLHHNGFTLNTDGSYTLDPMDKSFDHLAVGEHETLTIPVTVTDPNGGTDTQQLVITVNGTNDLPVISSISQKFATEGGAPVTGSVTATDIDHGDTLTYSSTFSHSGFVFNKDGSYTIDPTDKSFDYLAAGQTQVLTIPVIATDMHGGKSVSQNLVVTVTGTNDIPVVSAPIILPAGKEDLTQTITSAQLLANSTDVDTTDILTVTNVHVDHGTVTTDASGTVHYTPEHNYNGQVKFSYDVLDGHGGVAHTSATTDLAKVQDAAVISSTPVDVTEDTKTTATIHLGITDADKGEDHFQTAPIPGAHGSATITADGILVYTLDNAAAQHLNVNQSITDTIKVTSADGTTHDVSIIINGTNDNPVIGAITTQSATEDGLQVSGKVTATDVDTGDTASYATTAAPAGFILHSDGSYSFDPTDNAYQHLAAGKTQAITIPVTATDSHSGVSAAQNLVITITGTNDIPIVSAPIVLPAGKEDLTQTITSAQLLANTTDIDTTDILTVTKVHVDHGTVTTDASGTVHYTPEHNYNGQVTFTYDVLDGHGGVAHTSATTDLAKVQDAAVISSTQIDVTEDTKTTATIQLGITDADKGEDHFQTAPIQGAHGSATITADGTLVYTLTNAAAQHLNVNQSITDIIKVTSADGTTHDVSVIINGTNDNPVIGAITAHSATEDGSKVSGKVTSTDVDTGDTASYATTAAPAGFVLHSDGSYSFDPTNNAYQHLAAGKTQVLTIPVTATDSHSGVSAAQNLVITITGTNDKPVFTGVTTGPVSEDHNLDPVTHELVVTGHVLVNDVDTGESGLKQVSHISGTDQNGSPAVGSLNIVNDLWTYTANNTDTRIQSLGVNEKRTETFKIESLDGTQSTISVTIHGTNDIPTLSVGQSSHIAGALSETDVDTTDTHAFTTTHPAGHFGHLDIDAQTGAYTYHQTPSVTGMNYDKATGIYSAKDVFEIKVDDHHGGVTSKFITFDVNATVSVPPHGPNIPVITITVPTQPTVTITAPHIPATIPPANGVTIDLLATSDTGKSDTDNITKDNTPTLSGTTDIPFSKVEIHDASGVVATTYSDAHGHYSVTTSKLGDALHSLTAQATAPSATSHVDASMGVTVDTEIHAHNDAASATEDQTTLVNGHVLSNDDKGATVTTTGDIAGTYGTYHLNTDGSFTYKLDNTKPAVQALQAGHHLPDTISYSIIDTAGNTTQAKLTTTITGTNDGAVIKEVVTESATEDVHKTARGELSVTDIDSTEAHFQANHHINGQHGYLSLEADGKWEYHLDNHSHAVQSLSENELLQDSITVHSVDGTSYQLTLAITGVNDNPRLRGIHKTLNEDTSVSGDAHVIDIDNNDTHIFSVKAAVAGFHIDPKTGHYSFNAGDAAYQHLQVGQTARVIVDLAVADNHGGTAHRNIVFTVHGTNDAPVVKDVDLHNTNEDHSLTFHNSDLLSKTTDAETDNQHLHISNVHVDPQYGTIIDHGMGNYEFHPKHDYNGKDVPIHFDVGDGRTTTSGTALVDVLPVNDKPVVHRVDLGHIDEDTTKTFTEADLLKNTTDVDSAHNLLQVLNPHVAPAIGQISGDRVHGFVFTPNPNWNGQNLHINFDVIDDKGAKSSGHALLDVTPVQDPSIITQSTTSPQDLAVTEDSKTDNTASGKLNIQDPDTGDEHFRATSTVTGQYGVLRIVADGHWTYTLNNANAHVQELNAGQSVTDNVQIHAKDGTAYTVQVVVAGTNDTPVITSVGSVSAKEDGAQVTGQIDATDADKGDVLTYSLAHTIAGLTVDPTTGAYSFNPVDTAYQHLQEGEQQTIIADVLVTDSHGASATQQLAIVIDGTNDVPKVQDVKLANINEDTKVTFDASHLLANTTDLDQDKLVISHVSLQDSTIGTITEDGKGGYTFQPNHNYNGQNVKIDFSVTDGIATQSGIAHIDVLPVNDAPVVHNVNLGHTVHAITFTETALLHHSSDVDHDHLSLSGPPTVDAKFGHIVDNGNGSYTFTPTPQAAPVNSWAQQHPHANAHAVANHPGGGSQSPAPVDLHIQIHFNVTDGQATTPGIANLVQNPSHTTIHNTIIKDVVIGHAVEDLTLSATGTMAAHDPDGTLFDHFQPVSAHHGTYGSLTMGANGQWTYTLTANTDPAIQSLGKGAVLHDTFVVHSADGTAHTLKIPIQGTDDKATITPQSATVATEDSASLSATGKLDITDIDKGEDAFKAVNYIKAGHGHLQIDAQGHWTYHLNNNNPDVQKLGTGEHLTDTVVVQTVSGQSYSLDVVVNGTNDKAVISLITAQSATEGDATLRGTVLATDVDTSDTHLTFAMQTGQQAPAGFVIHADGSYSFDPANAAYSHMTSHQTQVLDIPVSVTDGHGETDTKILKITITGANSGPTADAHVDLGATKEDTSQTFTESGLIALAHGTDLDLDSLHVQNMHVAHGTIHDDGQGNFTFKPDANFHQDNIPVTYEITDGQKSVIVHGVLDVTSVNDVPVVSHFSLGTINEDTDKHFSAHDLLNHASDVDHDALSLVGNPTIDAKYGTITGDAANGFVFKPVANYHANSLPIHFTVSDGQASVQATAQINVRSVADPAVISDLKTDHATEDTKLTATGQVEVKDADGHQFEHVQASSYMAGHFGHLEIDSTGKWEYHLDQNHNVQYLAQGEVYTEQFTVKSADGTTHPIHVDIQGTNDAGSITGTATATILENTATATGKLTVHDIDKSEAHAVANANMPGTYGHLEVMTNGQWVYHLDSNAKVEALHQGETHAEKFTVTSPDGAHKDVVVTVQGTNDAPFITGHAVLTHSNEDVKVVISEHDLLQNVTDVDNTDILSVHNLTVDHGKVSGDVQHGYTYTPQKDFSGTVTFSYDVQDNHGGTVHSTISKEVDPVFDTGTVTVDPVTADNIINSVESGQKVEVSGHAAGGDISTGDHVSFSINGQSYSAVVDANGAWKADVAGSDLLVQKTFAVNVASTDGTASGTSTTSHTVRVDTKATATADTAAAHEDQSGLTIGNVLTNDEQGATVTSTTVVGAFGTYQFQQDGKYTYQLNSAKTQHLTKGQTVTDPVPYSITDKAGNTATAILTTTITGTNDIPVVQSSSVTTGHVVEDSQVSNILGVLDIHDIDSGASHTITVDPSHTAQYGTLTMMGDNWVYHLDNNNQAVDGLNTGDTLTDTVKVLIDDGMGGQVSQDIVVTIEGHSMAVPSLHQKSISPAPSVQHDEPDETTSENVTVTIHTDHIDVSHEPNQSITSEPKSETTTSTDSSDDLSGLISTEQPLNLDTATETRHVADTQATGQQTDTTGQDSDIHTTTHTDTDDSDTVAAGDVLNDQGNDKNIDDLLANQPEKAPVASPKTEAESVASSADTQHDTEPAPVADTSTLDSNLVDTPEDQ